MGRILAIDYGKKRCGIAVTDPLQIIAKGLQTVETHHLVDFLKDYFSKEEVDLIVMGLPKNLDGSDTDATNPVRHYAGRLRRAFPAIRVVFTDEQYSSKMASQAMVDMGMKKMQRRDKSRIDEIAAAIILRDYLDGHRAG